MELASIVSKLWDRKRRLMIEFLYVLIMISGASTIIVNRWFSAMFVALIVIRSFNITLRKEKNKNNTERENKKLNLTDYNDYCLLKINNKALYSDINISLAIICLLITLTFYSFVFSESLVESNIKIISLVFCIMIWLCYFITRKMVIKEDKILKNIDKKYLNKNINPLDSLDTVFKNLDAMVDELNSYHKTSNKKFKIIFNFFNVIQGLTILSAICFAVFS